MLSRAGSFDSSICAETAAAIPSITSRSLSAESFEPADPTALCTCCTPNTVIAADNRTSELSVSCIEPPEFRQCYFASVSRRRSNNSQTVHNVTKTLTMIAQNEESRMLTEAPPRDRYTTVSAHTAAPAKILTRSGRSRSGSGLENVLRFIWRRSNSSRARTIDEGPVFIQIAISVNNEITPPEETTFFRDCSYKYSSTTLRSACARSSPGERRDTTPSTSTVDRMYLTISPSTRPP